MPFVEVKAGDDEKLQSIAQCLQKARKIVAVTGAGISTSCGIPVGLLTRLDVLILLLALILTFSLGLLGLQISSWSLRPY